MVGDKTIRIFYYCSAALSITNGEVIKNVIEENIEKSEKIILDFEGITLFATPFFNLAIGHFIIKLTPKIFDNKIKCINLTELGSATLQYSYDNACMIYKNSIKAEEIDEINKIIDDNISEV